MGEGIKAIKKRWSTIDGVIHAAGVAHTKSILEKEWKDFYHVLHPKIDGTIVLDELLCEEPLDFVCYCSSASAIMGDFGFCDYAIASRFQMTYARYRNKLVAKEKRRGHTVAILWPLWEEGEMGFKDKSKREAHLKATGQRTLATDEGIAAFEYIITQKRSHQLVLVGNKEEINHFLTVKQKPNDSALSPSSLSKAPVSKESPLSVDFLEGELHKHVESDIKAIISELLQVDIDKLTLKGNLTSFGFDSISLADFAHALTKHYENGATDAFEITPALFFGYSTIEKLTEYFLQHHSQTIKNFYNKQEPQVHTKEAISIISPGPFSTNKTLSSKSEPIHSTEEEPIAIIGMSGRFPKSRNIDEMWDVLFEGRHAITTIPLERFDRGQKTVRSQTDKTIFNCGCIPGIEEFDPLFFELSPFEAEAMDPRQRLLLQETWNALENAGYGESHISENKMGMFVGVEQGDYLFLNSDAGGLTSNHDAILAARLAYFLNFSGPTLSINTACSSGLVAAHQACNSLRQGECQTAVVAAANLLVTPASFIKMHQAGILSEDGISYVFDQRANGMVPGEAAVALVLKPLRKAISSGDPIHAVIRGSGINYDGKTNGITAPNGLAQTQLLKDVYDKYKVNPETIDYVVTHGTGTSLGDPVEVNALTDAFKSYTQKQRYCALTSNKTNFGHTFAASGLTSIINLVQSFKHELIPASLHCDTENDYIVWKESPFFVNKKNKAWPSSKDKRRKGAISAFGMSGTNAHMVMESWDESQVNPFVKNKPYTLLILSAKTAESLREKIISIIAYFENKPVTFSELHHISYTLLVGRHHFQNRCVILAHDKEEAIRLWKAFLKKEKVAGLFKGEVPHNFEAQKSMSMYAQNVFEQLSISDNDHNEDSLGKYKDELEVLADLYCQGYSFSWEKLFQKENLNRVPLPTYPFTRKKYWVTPKETVTPVSAKEKENHYNGAVRIEYSHPDSVLHPLLHKNTSNFKEQRFSTTWTGDEFFLADHKVNKERILPGVAFLEMAREAIEQTIEKTNFFLCLKNVVWQRPISLGKKAKRLHH